MTVLVSSSEVVMSLIMLSDINIFRIRSVLGMCEGCMREPFQNSDIISK